MTLRNDPCSCGSGKRFKDCHGRLSADELAPACDVVDFVIAGTQRGGTTTLDLHLRRHSQIAMAATRKELHFFDHEKRFRREPVDYSVYHRHFPRLLEKRLHGEATPIYMYWSPAPQRMARYNPELKIIMILRNPISRAYSHWNMERQRGQETLPFLDAVMAEPDRAREALPLQLRDASYVDRGFYTRQLQRVWQHFPVNQTLILRTEELQASPDATLQRIASFLAIEPFPRVDATMANSLEYSEPMSPKEWAYLAGVYAAEISDLERMLGWNCSAWRSERPRESEGSA